VSTASTVIAPVLAEVTRMWKGGLGGDAPDWLSRHGWQPRSHDRAALAAAYGRAVTRPSIGGFLTAVRPYVVAPSTSRWAEEK
jgi:hypothetical protein